MEITIANIGKIVVAEEEKINFFIFCATLITITYIVFSSTKEENLV